MGGLWSALVKELFEAFVVEAGVGLDLCKLEADMPLPVDWEARCCLYVFSSSSIK